MGASQHKEWSQYGVLTDRLSCTPGCGDVCKPKLKKGELMPGMHVFRTRVIHPPR